MERHSGGLTKKRPHIFKSLRELKKVILSCRAHGIEKMEPFTLTSAMEMNEAGGDVIGNVPSRLCVMPHLEQHAASQEKLLQ